jgi:hypothetical protein
MGDHDEKDEVKGMEERSHLSFIPYPLSSFFTRLTTSLFTCHSRNKKTKPIMMLMSKTEKPMKAFNR